MIIYAKGLGLVSRQTPFQTSIRSHRPQPPRTPYEVYTTQYSLSLWFRALTVVIRVKLRLNTKESNSQSCQTKVSFALRISLAKRSCFNISADNQNHGGKCIFSPRISRLARKKTRFTEDSLSFGRAYQTQTQEVGFP